MKHIKAALFTMLFFLMAACGQAPIANASQPQTLNVLSVETFLTDIAQNVAGDRFKIDSLLPIGLDPHAFEPTPQDITRIAKSNVLIINGMGVEEWLEETQNNAGGERLVIEAAAGMTSRAAREGEPVEPEEEGHAHHHDEGDPHFWLDPVSVIHYVENIRDGFSQVDPQGKEIYAKNAEQYISQLKTLDKWIQEQVAQVPAEKRLLVTNHESFGYFADRYGFKVVGAIIPSVSTSASPSAQELANLSNQIKATHTTAIFLEVDANPQLAEQVARETGIQVVTGLITHSVTGPDGKAPTYIDMMKYNTLLIVSALK